MGVSEAAQLYGKSRKWVSDQIDRYQIRTETEENWTRLRLVDLIAHRGEPLNGAPQTSETHSEQGQIITLENRVVLTPKKLGSVSNHCGIETCTEAAPKNLNRAIAEH